MSASVDNCDREYIQFRTVDPCHAEYLTAMGGQSFETWRELQQNKARPWVSREIELAQILGSHFAIAILQYQMYQQICTLNTSLEQRVKERTTELQQTNQQLIQEISDRLKTRDSLERLSHQNELILNSAGENIYGLNLEGIQ